MPENEMTPEQKAAEIGRLKCMIDGYEREWDRLDAHGSLSDRQNTISTSIERTCLFSENRSCMKCEGSGNRWEWICSR